MEKLRSCFSSDRVVTSMDLIAAKPGLSAGAVAGFLAKDDIVLTVEDCTTLPCEDTLAA